MSGELGVDTSIRKNFVDMQVLESMVTQMQRVITRDGVMPSTHRRVTAAALFALAALAVTHPESEVLKG